MTDLIRVMTRNIELATDAMEDGQTGYVLHTPDHTLFVVEEGEYADLRLGSAFNAKVMRSLPRAETLRRFWNSRLTQQQIEAGCGVVSTLRREALAGFIEVQQHLLGVLTPHVATDDRPIVACER
jgi:hypothetical protein